MDSSEKLYSKIHGKEYSYGQLFKVVNERNKQIEYSNILSASQEKGMVNRYDLNLGNYSIFRHDNFIGCFSADKIKMSVRKYFCFNIPVYKNMAEGLFCHSPYHEEYIQTSASGNPEGLCRSTYSFLSERR